MNTILFEIEIISAMALIISLLNYMTPKCLEYPTLKNVCLVVIIAILYCALVPFSEELWNLGAQTDLTYKIFKITLLVSFVLSPLFSFSLFAVTFMLKNQFEKIHNFSKVGIKSHLVLGPLVGLIVGLVAVIVTGSITAMISSVVLVSFFVSLGGLKEELKEQR